LPSDSTYRADILFARIDDEENSQIEKQKLE
jgi:hypothetical protein